MPQQLFPTVLTLCNFICGVFAILFVFEQKVGVSILYISLGLVFDSLDGWSARELNAVSTFGKELDSLSDIVTFGLAPSIVAYQLVLSGLGKVGLGIVLFFTIGSVLRLARFNTMQSDLPVFVGLPVPGAAIGLLVSVLFMPPWLVAISTCFLAWLMVSHVRFPHLKKMKVDGEKANGFR